MPDKPFRLLSPHPDGSEAYFDVPLTGKEVAGLLATSRRIKRPIVSPYAELCYVVYVALLKAVPGEPPYSLYVGSASGKVTEADDDGQFPCEWRIGPQRRFRDHLRNHKAGAGWVRDYGVGLLPDLYTHLNPITNDIREAFEASVAKRFRDSGWVVHQH